MTESMKIVRQDIGDSEPEWLLRSRTVRLISIAAGWFLISLAFLYGLKLYSAFSSSIELAQEMVAIRALLAFVGIAGAIAGLVLLPTMLWYWAKLDSSSRAGKILWLLVFFVGFGFGFPLYALLVYRKQARRGFSSR